MTRWLRYAIAFLTLLFFALPFISIGMLALTGEPASLKHLADTVLWTYIKHSLLLVSGTVILALLIGFPCAYVVTRYRFWGQGVLQWLLCLPLAMPAYLVAYLYTDLLDYAGPIQTFLRQLFDWPNAQHYWFPAIRTLEGACVILALCLYPYVFLMARLALLDEAVNLTHSAKLLGASSRRVLWKVTLPMIRPALAVGCALVAMETIGDFGTVYFFAVPTLTTAIYDSWLSFGDPSGAALIGVTMLGFVMLIMIFEQYSRRQQRQYQRGTETRIPPKPLHGLFPRLGVGLAWTVVTLALFYPVAQLSYWAIHYWTSNDLASFVTYIKNSLTISVLAAILCVGFSLLLHTQARQQRSFVTRLPIMTGHVGYAIPGTVLALGLLIPFTKLDSLLYDFTQWLGVPPLGLIFSGTIVALLVAFTIRFASMPIGSLETALAHVPPSLDNASRLLGYSTTKTWIKVHLPLIRKGILTSLLFVFIEGMKELNASLLLRPFGFETLVTHVYSFTSDEQLERAALPALVLILAGLIPVIFLTRSLLKDKKS